MGYIVDEKATTQAIALLKKVMSYTDFKVQVDSYPFTLTFSLRKNHMDIAGFTLVEQANCCGILVSTKTFVHDTFKGQGIAQEMMPLKESLALEFGYTLLMATVNMTGNPAEVHILEKFNWKLVDQFVNKRTGNTVGIFTKNLSRG